MDAWWIRWLVFDLPPVRRERLHLPRQVGVETGVDSTGRYYVVCHRNGETYLRCPNAVQQLAGRFMPKHSKAALASWLESLQASDQLS